jgi:STIP1 family protein 1
MAYEYCSKSVQQTSSAFAISGFVLKCKKAKWDLRESDRLRRRSELLNELEVRLAQGKDEEIASITARAASGELGQVAVKEETDAAEESLHKKLEELRNAFAISNPASLTRRVSTYH